MTFLLPIHLRLFVLSLAALCLVSCGSGDSGTGPAPFAAPGGFVEKSGSAVRPRLSTSEIQSFVPNTRGTFNFPPPYSTQGYRLSDASDCGGADCVMPIGYSYWRNMNNHANSGTVYIFFTFYRPSGGAGPTLFSLDKTTDQITKIGPLFSPDTTYSWRTGEGWYFSASQPTKLYIDDNAKLLRYDVLSRQFEEVFDVTRMYGSDRAIQQTHSSNDDIFHSATLMVASTGEVIGCVFFREDIQQFTLYPKVGPFDECHLDKSGRWLVSLEQVDGLYNEDMRVFDTSQGTEIARVLNQDGAPGHLDMGFGYLVGADGWSGQPGSFITWTFGSPMVKGPLDFTSYDWNTNPANHVSHENAKPGVSMERQFACGSNADQVSYAANEVVCFRLDGSKESLVVAPIMTDMGANGGGADTYNKYPKGNVDVMGEYFIWTSNLGGSRLDAFLVKIPSQLLISG